MNYHVGTKVGDSVVAAGDELVETALLTGLSLKMPGFREWGRVESR